MSRKFNASTDNEDRIFRGMVGYLLLKNGYSVRSISKSLQVPLTFVEAMASDGQKIGTFNIGSQSVPKVMRQVRLDKTDFLACFRRIVSPETPLDIFAQSYGMSLAEAFLCNEFSSRYASYDPLIFMQEKRPKRIKEPVKVFATSKCDFGAGLECEAKVLFQSWVKWCKNYEVDFGNIQGFSRKLKGYFSNIDTVKVGEKSTESEKRLFSRKFIGIGLKQVKPNQA